MKCVFVFLLLILVPSFCTYGSDFNSKNEEGYIIYYNILSDSECEVARPNSRVKYSGDIKIPESVNYNGAKLYVKGIGDNAFMDYDSLTSVSIPSRVRRIGISAFKNCIQLQSLILPDSLVEIAESAFEKTSIYEINLPSSVLTIGDKAFFRSCLTSIEFGEGVDSIGRYAFAYSNLAPSIKLPGSLRFLEEKAFEGCIDIQSVFLGDKLSKICAGTFEGCWKLSKIFGGNNISQINADAFSRCTNLKEIILPGELTEIGSGCFGGCSSLEKINLPSSLIYIGISAFENCSKLCSISIPEKITSIENKCFKGCSALSDISFPEGLRRINSDAFQGCRLLQSVHLPQSLDYIDSYAFCNCGLLNISIPKSVYLIGSHAFQDCSNLNSIYIPNSVYQIGAAAFYYCNSLEKVEFESIESICKIKFGDFGSNPLYYAHHLFVNGEEVFDLNVPEGVSIINENAFRGSSYIRSVNLPSTLTKIKTKAFLGCTSLTKVRNNAFVPPTADSDSFIRDGINYYLTLEVPLSREDVYSDAPVWRSFEKIVEFENDLSIDVIRNDSEIFNMFNLDGTSSINTKGIRILRTSNSSNKILLKQ